MPIYPRSGGRDNASSTRHDGALRTLPASDLRGSRLVTVMQVSARLTMTAFLAARQCISWFGSRRMAMVAGGAADLVLSLMGVVVQR